MNRRRLARLIAYAAVAVIAVVVCVWVAAYAVAGLLSSGGG